MNNENWVDELKPEELKPEELPEPYNALAVEIGIENVYKIAKMYGGGYTYFPKLDTLMIPKRNSSIRKEFNGYNAKELARKYNLSVRWVEKICEDIINKKRNEPVKGQMSLFDSA